LEYHDPAETEGFVRQHFTYDAVVAALFALLTEDQKRRYSVGNPNAWIGRISEEQKKSVLFIALNQEINAPGERPAWAIYSDFWLTELQGLWDLLGEDTKKLVLEKVKPIWDKLDTGVPFPIQEFMERAARRPDPATGIRITQQSFTFRPDEAGNLGGLWVGNGGRVHPEGFDDGGFGFVIDALGPGKPADHPFVQNSRDVFTRDALGGIARDSVTHELLGDEHVFVVGALSSMGNTTPIGHYAPAVAVSAQPTMAALVESMFCEQARDPLRLG